MAAPAVRADEDAWRRVAQHVAARRRDLGSPTDAEIVARAGTGLSVPVLSRIGNAQRTSYSPRSLDALCRGLGWTSDSIERILAGGDPALTDTEAEEAPFDLRAELAEIRAMVEEIRAEQQRRRP